MVIDVSFFGVLPLLLLVCGLFALLFLYEVGFVAENGCFFELFLLEDL